jgi:hypothetical protein
MGVPWFIFIGRQAAAGVAKNSGREGNPDFEDSFGVGAQFG